MHNLGYSGETQIIRNILWSNAVKVLSDERLKYLIKSFITQCTLGCIPLFLLRNRMIIGITLMKISSSISGLHYGKYKVHTSSMLISTVKCNLVNLAVKNGTTLER